VGRFLRAGIFLQHSRPSPFLQTGPHIFLPQVDAKRALVPHGPHMSASLLHGHEPLCKPTCLRPLGRGNPSPFHCSTPHRLSVKFRPRSAPRCSVQATVGCPAAFPRLLPCLLAAIKLYCPLTLLPPPLHLYVVVATPGAAVMPWARHWETSLGQSRASSLLTHAWMLFRPGCSLPFLMPMQRALARPCAPRGRIDSPPLSISPRQRSMDKTPPRVPFTQPPSHRCLTEPLARMHTMRRAVRPVPSPPQPLPGQAGSVLWPGRGRPSTHCACGPRAWVSAQWLSLNRKFIFIFHSVLFNFKFENPYLNIHSSKNYETSSVGFVIL
jgi:hypothetical protein